MSQQNSQQSSNGSRVRAKSKWLAMVYLAGDNNLSTESVFALTEMERVGSDQNLFIIAQLDSGIYDGTPLIIEGDSQPGGIVRRLREAKKAKQKLMAGQQRLMNGLQAANGQNGSEKRHFDRILEFV
jgi:hypothetical protein